MRKLQQGFTLIELVVVITILGILAAFAIPRFASLDSSARAAAISGLAGSIRSASALAHAIALSNGTAQAATGTVTMEGYSVTMVNGYPSGVAGGITAALQDTSSFTPAYAAGPPTTATFQNTSNQVAACQVVYTASTAVNVAPVITLTASATTC
jgi:MSHA pilin protein MshA